MKSKNIIVLMVGFLFFSTSCRVEESHIPKPHPDLSFTEYSKYAKLLDSAYENGNHLDASLHLANLKAEKEIIFQTLENAIRENPENCSKIYEWYWMYDRHNFAINLVKSDTLLFKSVVNLCGKLNPGFSYFTFLKTKQQDEGNHEENTEKEDSSKFDLILIRQLKQIYKDDQAIRNELNKKNISPERIDSLLIEMEIIDSINLEKIDLIFKEYGYPSKDLVGKEGNFTPALIIHHNKLLETRYKYLPILEKAVKDGILFDGTFKMIKRRMKEMEMKNLD